jgi:hypothetical protein
VGWCPCALDWPSVQCFCLVCEIDNCCFAGYDDARAAVAKFYTCPESPLTADDVVLASGCSGALELAMASGKLFLSRLA